MKEGYKEELKRSAVVLLRCGGTLAEGWRYWKDLLLKGETDLYIDTKGAAVRVSAKILT